MWDRLESIEARYAELTREMARFEVAADYERLQRLVAERSGIEQVVLRYRKYRDVERDIAGARQIAEESEDPELVTLARQELSALAARREALVQEITRLLLPRDPRDEKDVIVELRAGEGGQEAALFAADLFRMYTRYAERRGWSAEVLSLSETGIGGFKEVIFELRGQGAYSRLKYESGVHRVQRVPVTEAQGRIHTSTATVAVLPKADEVEVNINREEIREDIFHSGGAGGQNVNKVATAVRLTHLPTGIVVTCQDERSQLRNRLKAMAILRARLLDMEVRRQQEQITESRRAQVGRAERAEKLRTYNFPQDRVTDHRIGLTVHNLEGVLDGDLDPIIDAVATEEQARLLQGQAV